MGRSRPPEMHLSGGDFLDVSVGYRKPSRLARKVRWGEEEEEEDAAVVTGLSASDSPKTHDRMAERDKALSAVDTHKQTHTST